MSERDDLLAEIRKSGEGDQTIGETATNIISILGLPRDENVYVMRMISESDLSDEDLLDEILDEYADDDEFDDAGDYDEEDDA